MNTYFWASIVGGQSCDSGFGLRFAVEYVRREEGGFGESSSL